MTGLTGKKLKHIWGLASTAAKAVNMGKEDYLYNKVSFMFDKTRLHMLTAFEVEGLISSLILDVSRIELNNRLWTAKQWGKIKWLQRQLDWDNRHLRIYLQTITGISHERFLTQTLARDVIAGLSETLNYRRERGISRSKVGRLYNEECC